MWSLIGWSVFGLIAGLVSRALAPGHARFGLLGTIVLGILGSLLGGVLSSLLFRHEINMARIEPSGFIGAVIGGIIILTVPRMLVPRPPSK